MKKKLFFLVNGAVLIVIIGVTLSSFIHPEPVESISPEPIAISSPDYSSITIDCDGLGTSDYVAIEYMGYCTDCLGYTDEWSNDEGTRYFDASGHIEITSLIGGYKFGYFGVKILVTKVGADCTYQEIKYAGGYHLPDSCNTVTQHISFDIDYPWSCPEE